MSIQEKLLKIQTELKAPKGQYNSFGKYAYRNCEDILEALKPLLDKYNATLVLSDEIVVLGEHSPTLYTEEVYDKNTKSMKEETRVTGDQRFYIKAKAELFDTESNESIHSMAFAREDETKKGMDLSQLTGSTSSYARKYALNGLFAIDDTKDSDSTNTHGKGDNATTTKEIKGLSEAQIKRLYAIAKSASIDADTVKNQVKTKFNKEVTELTKAEYDTVCKGYEGLKK